MQAREEHKLHTERPCYEIKLENEAFAVGRNCSRYAGVLILVFSVVMHLADSFHSSSSPSRCKVSISVKSVGVGMSSSSFSM